MSDSLLITPALGDAAVTAGDAARLERDDLVARSQSITTVSDRLDADHATSFLRDAKAYLTGIEAARTRAKAPVLEIGKRIDALAKDLVAQVQAESTRISRVLGAFELEEKRKADEARWLAENEARRVADEALRKAAAARSSAPDALAADRAADVVTAQAAEQIVALKQAAANAAPARQAGTAVREDVVFEVTDIRALYSAHPELVTLEPNGAAIRAILRANPNLQVPGLRHWREAKLNIRSHV
jgi:hypothetical protein